MANGKETVMEVDGIKYLSVSSMAKVCGVSASYIRAEIGRKKIRAFKDQRGWLFVAEPDAEKFRERRTPRFEPVP